MLNLISIIVKFHYAWLNDEPLPLYLIEKVQTKIDDLYYQSNLYSDVAGHYLTLSDFKQSRKYSRKSDRCIDRIDAIIDTIESHNKGYLVLNNISY